MADPKKRPIQSDPGLSDLEINKGFGDLEIRWSGFRRKSPRHFSMNARSFVGPHGFGEAHQTAASGAKRPLAKAAKSAKLPEWTLCVPPCVPDCALAGIDRRAGCRPARTTVPLLEEAFALGGMGRKPSGLVSCPTQTHPLSKWGKIGGRAELLAL
jgi:hypothetical protein